ncbi:MOSC domain-containing protein [Anaeromicrobium sediminis]|uniref:MOSC domain-containing protein n=1 Tax=Anaeromicrobium sediminis TaxID=1478221 RepID=A0A267MB73_9FIRM|nr:MOSC domain-containing protein [Anaeromicrobium sediminis]PAB56806.1 MOSC domain-containing protein [Anaeromicrobium sediminis]
MGKIMAVCISEKKGTQKKDIKECELVENFGLKNDAHGGKWHRQVSLLSYEKIEDFKAKGVQVGDGDFGENLVVSGIDLSSLPVGTKLTVNDALLEVTQIGKECHHHCQIYHAVGDCIMPREGIFVRVLKGGAVKTGDEISIVE